ncbi:Asp23/Gls24 family envelope stress response protein [Lentilactobacillus senioris]|uniref:Asp23/Gls24 family envelope stress response protein n=1 Tax=Lentilactobacillus senioris TaxID=931534 RepID=UPI0006D1846F|nr:Asp23/Gls24 family envelope stress response protein [Lentilactobacillus senioris]
MAEDTNIILQSDNPNLGEIQITPEVLEIIAGIAAVEVDGVNRMQSNSLSKSVNELFGRRKEHSRGGVKISYDGDQLTVDISVFLNYGVSVPKVALEIQDQVKEQLLFMTNLKAQQVNVHVAGVVPEKETANTVDPNDPFANSENEE